MDSLAFCLQCRIVRGCESSFERRLDSEHGFCFLFLKRLFTGVDTSLRNELGKYPIDIAREKNFDGIVSLLQDEVDATQMLDSPRDLKVLLWLLLFFVVV